MDKNRFKYFYISIFCTLLFSSCVVNNNLYTNDPTPMEKGEIDVNLGVGSGMYPSIDSVSANNKIYYSNQIKSAVNLTAGGQFGIGRKMNMKIICHFPKIIGGIGLRGTYQYSFFNKSSPFNSAIGVDIGGVIGRDSLRIGGTAIETPHDINGAMNGDVFLPISYSVNENFRIILTPRYNVNYIFVKKYTDRMSSSIYQLNAPVLTLGLRIKGWFYAEASAIYHQNKIYPYYGVTALISVN